MNLAQREAAKYQEYEATSDEWLTPEKIDEMEAETNMGIHSFSFPVPMVKDFLFVFKHYLEMKSKESA